MFLTTSFFGGGEDAFRLVCAGGAGGSAQKAWVEVRMGWLADEFGLDRLRKVDVAVPEEHYFPDAYEATPEGARVLMTRVCGYMGVRPEEIDFQVLNDDEMPGAAGQFALRRRGWQPPFSTVRFPEMQRSPKRPGNRRREWCGSRPPSSRTPNRW